MKLESSQSAVASSGRSPSGGRNFARGFAAAALLLALFASSSARGEKNAPPDDDSGDRAPNDDKEKKPDAPAESADKCVTHTTQARFVMGYDHLVHIKNDCSKGATCQVSTNVNPKVQSILVPAHEKKTVLTYRGSPASEFVANVDCKLVSK